MRAKNVALACFLVHGAGGLASIFIGIWVGLGSPLFLGFLLLGSGLLCGIVFVHLRERLVVSIEEEAIGAAAGKRGPSARLFEESTGDSFSARTRLRQMEHWFLPTASLLCAFYFLSIPIVKFADIIPMLEMVSDGRPLVAALGIVAIAFILFILGKYSSGLASAPEWGLLESGGLLSIFCAISSLAVSCGLVMVHMGLPKVEMSVSYLVLTAAGVLGIELLVNFVLHLYRPKLPSAEYHPPYASRLLRVFARPIGVSKTVAQALDYQFGFKISETWFYRFIEKAIAPLILFWAIAFYGLTCIVVISPEQQAIVERFGIPDDSLLQPGLHFKLPLPIEKVFKYPVKRVMRLTIGVSEEDLEQEDIYLWTAAHGHSNNLIVASSETVSREEEDLGFVPVNLLNTSVDIHYCISDLPTFHYKQVDPVRILESIVSGEVMRFVVSVDLFDIMGPGRLRASKHLTSRIRDACRDAELGLEIVYVGLENVHPPVEVADAFEDVVGAIEEQHAAVFAAESYRNRILPLAEYETIVLRTQALSYKFRRETVASASVEQFRKQNEADRRLSRTYRMRKYLSTLEEGLRDSRKYVRPQKLDAKQITIIDLTEKVRPELLNMDLTGMEEK